MHCNLFPWQQLVRASLLPVKRAVGLVVGPFQTPLNPVSPSVKECILYLDIKLHTIACSRYSQTHKGFAALSHGLAYLFLFPSTATKNNTKFCYTWWQNNLLCMATAVFSSLLIFIHMLLHLVNVVYKNRRKCWGR